LHHGNAVAGTEHGETVYGSGSGMKRVSLLPHRNDWSELERDAVTMRQGVIRAKSKPVPGSVQWVFANSGPP
jgi:hypothetical protein